ncbi:hypothetical protein D3C85_1031670 [compost metagenome]
MLNNSFPFLKNQTSNVLGLLNSESPQPCCFSKHSLNPDFKPVSSSVVINSHALQPKDVGQLICLSCK